LRAGRGERGNPESLQRHGVAEVERADFGLDLEMYTISRDDRREAQADAEFLELDGNRRAAAASLRDGNRKLTAREEAGFLAAFCDQVRLGEALEEDRKSVV